MMRGRTCLLVVLVVTSAAPALAQRAPLMLVDDSTTVRKISFRFERGRSFETGQLKSQIATAEPGFMDRVKRVLPFLQSAPYPFSALELQRDVARLRLFYRENGFPHAQIGYASSRFDEDRNVIHIIFTIDEGEPILVRTVEFLSTQGDPFPDPGEPGFEEFRDAVELHPRDRFSELRRVETRTQASGWLKDHGYAFAQLRDTAIVDTSALAADLRFVVDPGPLARFGDVQVEGNESVSRGVILRELPFRTGQLYSEARLKEGQREIFGLNLFRTALAELPPQSRDSSAAVRVRVREAKPQLITYRLGYGREQGTSLEGTYTHRNFLGAARTLTGTIVANTGLAGSPSGDRVPERRIYASVALRQPYVFMTKLSLTIAPFIQFARDQQLSFGRGPLGVNSREAGVTTTLLYEVLPFRTVSVQYTFSRASLASGTRLRDADRFNRSILTLSAVVGRANDYVNPSSGILVRPAVEMAGRVFGSGVQYYKMSNEITAYAPLGRRTGLAGRLMAGRLWPVGASTDQIDPVIENRFDPIRFYAGGGTDLRGWGDRLAGPKVSRPTIVDGDTLGFVYEPVGGLTKLAANAEFRLPFPGLGDAWGTAVFLDAASLSENASGRFHMGTGAGVRYRTPVGYVRLDLGYKLNPDPKDLRSAESVFFDGMRADAKPLRRFKLHLSIGQAF